MMVLATTTHQSKGTSIKGWGRQANSGTFLLTIHHFSTVSLRSVHRVVLGKRSTGGILSFLEMESLLSTKGKKME